MRNSYWMAPALIACNIAFAAGERGNSTIDGEKMPPGAGTTTSSAKGNADSTNPNVNADTRAHSRVATSRDAAKATKQIRSNAKKLRRVKPVGALPTLAKPESASPAGVGATTAPASMPSGTVARSSSMNTSSTVTVPSTILNVAPDSIIVRSGPAPLPVNSPIAINATASATPAVATTATTATYEGATANATSARGAAGASESEKPRLNARKPLTIRARIDDGRSIGFHQSGGDQPAGDQQFRPPTNRVQDENDRLRRESRAQRAGASASTSGAGASASGANASATAAGTPIISEQPTK